MATTVSLTRATARLRIHQIPVADDTVTVGDIVYTFKATPGAAYEVDVGATKAICIANLVGAINDDLTPSATTYHADTVANPFATAVASGEIITLTARSGGVMLAPVATLDGTAASSVLTFSADPADTDEVYIGDKVYIYKTTPAAPFDVDVGGAGGNKAGSLANLVAAINLTGSAGADTYFAGTTQNPYVSAVVTSATEITITARIAGTQGNGIFTGTSENDVGVPTGATLASGAKGNDFWDLSVTEVAAAGVLTFAADPVDTDEIYIGNAVYVFKDSPSSAGEVDVGATRAISVSNLIAAINLTGTAGTTYGAATVKNPFVTAALTSASVVTVTAIVPGVQANGIRTSTSEVDMTFAATTLAGGTGASAIETRFEGGVGNVSDFLIDVMANTDVGSEVMAELKKLTSVLD